MVQFIKANIISLFALGVYFLWWIYLLFDFSNKKYDNHFAGAMAAEAIGTLTIFFIVIYMICFLIAGFKTKNWKRYLLFISFLFVPVIITIIKIRKF
jgi:hypothetical protein